MLPRPINPDDSTTWERRSVSFTPRGSPLTLDATIVEHDASRDGVRHLFKIHLTNPIGTMYPPQVMASAEELTPRD